MNSVAAPVYVLAQYKPDSLLEHLRRAWCPHWPVYPLLPDAQGQYRGTADAVYRHVQLVERHRPDAVAVFAADHVYRMDVRQMARFNADRDADVTVAALAATIERASAFGVMSVSADAAIGEFHEKPAAPHPIPGKPQLAYASMGNYLFKPASITALLEKAMGTGGPDFGHDVLPRLAGSAYRVFAYDFARNEVRACTTTRNAPIGATWARRRHLPRRAVTLRDGARGSTCATPPGPSGAILTFPRWEGP